MKLVYRLANLAGVGLAVLGSLHAGQIAIGSTVGTLGDQGLTVAYMATSGQKTGGAASSTSCTGAQMAAAAGQSAAYASAGGCALPTVAGTETTYTPNLFQSAAPTTSITPAQTLTDGAGIVFRTTADTNMDMWRTSSLNGVTSSSINVAVGVYGVDKVYTLLNDYWGPSGFNDTTVTLNFGSAPNVADLAKTEIVKLTNGINIRASVDATGGSGNPPKTVVLTGSGFGSALGIATTLGNALTDLNTNSNVSVSTVAGVYNYTGYTSASGQYAHTTGDINLDEQIFSFANHTTDYLVSITVTNQMPDAGSGYATNTNGTGISRTALSAISLDVVTPEPSTYLMLASGLGLLGLLKRKRKA